ncbi:MAG: type II secretion system GspH family protein [Patescibacteria group bacterium]|nr:type II secretion system GspH family protein [Patescibacteria group bacterium]
MQKAFTLIELLVVMSIMAIAATIIFFATSPNDRNQLVANAQKEFIVNFRSWQNGVNQGADGLDYKYILLTNGATSYTLYSNAQTVIGSPVNLPSKVTIGLPSGISSLAVCLNNPNMTSYDGTVGKTACWNDSCGLGTYFACQLSGATYTPVNSGSIPVNFVSGTVSKSVTIEGSGMAVSRIW